MKSNNKLYTAIEKHEEKDSESENSEMDFKNKINDRKPKMNPNHMELMRQSCIMNNTIDAVFSDLKNNLKNSSKSSDLIDLSDEITKQTTVNAKQEKYESTFGTNYRSALVVNDDTEKNNLMYLNNKIDEEEKALKNLLNLH